MGQLGGAVLHRCIQIDNFLHLSEFFSMPRKPQVEYESAIYLVPRLVQRVQLSSLKPPYANALKILECED